MRRHGEEHRRMDAKKDDDDAILIQIAEF